MSAEVPIPTAAEIQEALKPLAHTKLQELSDKSGVPFGTLQHIRLGATKNPGIETVRAIYPYLTKQAAE